MLTSRRGETAAPWEDPWSASSCGSASRVPAPSSSPAPTTVSPAKLVEEAGFDGVWASGFEISASHGVPGRQHPDDGGATSTRGRQMVQAVDIPIVADCDNGYGNAINVIHTVREYEREGIAAICIEDNIFPKRCSFYAGVKRELAAGRGARRARSRPASTRAGRRLPRSSPAPRR